MHKNKDRLFLKEGALSLTYEQFWKRVINQKIPNADFVAIRDKGISLLIKYFAIIASGKKAIPFEDSLPIDYLIEKTKFISRNESFAFFNEDNATKKFENTISSVEEISTIIYTSGTTGNPKPIQLTHGNFLSSAHGTNIHYNITEKDNWASTLPFFHVGGLLIIYRTLLAQSHTSILAPNKIEYEILTDQEITHLSLVEAQLQKIIKNPNSLQRAKSLKGIILGGGKTSVKTLEAAINEKIKLSNSFGQTESCAQVLATPLTLDLEELKTVGRPLPYRDVYIENSHITIEGQTISPGIYGDENICKEIHTSDMAKKDNKGNFIIIGRSDDIFISGGENINPNEIDQSIKNYFDKKKPHLKIDQIITFKMADEKYGYCPHTLIKLNEDETNTPIDYDELKLYLKDVLANYKIPKSIYTTKSLEVFKKGIKLSKSALESYFKELYFLNTMGLRTSFYGDFSKPILMIFHGFMGQKEDFYFLLKDQDLCNNYCFAFIDLPGHSTTQDSPMSQFRTWESFENFFCQHLNSLSLKYSILGYSMGGRLAFSIATRLKKFPEYLILESTGPGITSNQDDSQKLKDNRLKSDNALLSNIKNQNDLLAFLDKWYQLDLFQGIKDGDQYQELLNKKSSRMIPFWQDSLSIFSLAHQRDLRGEVKNISSQKYYLYGQRDHKYKGFAQELEGEFTIHQVYGVSHNTHISNNVGYIDILKTILLK